MPEINISNTPKLYQDNDFVSIDYSYTLYSYSGTKTGNYLLLTPELDNMRDEWMEYEPQDIELNETKESGVVGGNIEVAVDVFGTRFATAKLNDESTISIIKNEDGTITCNYKIMSNKDELGAALAYKYATPNDAELARQIKKYRAETITINLLGTKITFNFNSNNETQASTENYTYNLSTNELMQEKAIYKDNYSSNGYNLAQLVKDNIVNDYSKGISTIIANTNCIDVNDINGNLHYIFKNGNIFKDGDIVRIDKDNNYLSLYKYSDGSDMCFKVTGRRFRKQGVPLIDLELQEVK
jgi:hypothetical protein